LLQLFEQLFTFFSLDLCWASRSRSVVGSLLDRFFLKPIEPVTDRFLNDTMPLSQRIELIVLLAPDRRENTLSRFSLANLLFEFVESLKRNLVEPTPLPILLRLSVNLFLKHYEMSSAERIQRIIPMTASANFLDGSRHATLHRVALPQPEPNQRSEQFEQDTIQRLRVEALDVQICFSSRNGISITVRRV
jgi:hypothetical protein